MAAAASAGCRAFKPFAPLHPTPAHLCLPLPPGAASVLQVVLALGAAAISVLFFAPAMRYVHAYWLQVRSRAMGGGVWDGAGSALC